MIFISCKKREKKEICINWNVTDSALSGRLVGNNSKNAGKVWSFGKRQLLSTIISWRAEARVKDRELEEAEERHQTEVKVYKQKVKHLLYEQEHNIAELKAENMVGRMMYWNLSTFSNYEPVAGQLESVSRGESESGATSSSRQAASSRSTSSERQAV